MTGLVLKIGCDGDRGFCLDVDCELPAGSVTAIHGPSGSGKTTLLDCIAGLREPDCNSIIRVGDNVWQGPGCSLPPWQRPVGYVFQDARLFPHLDVRQNLLFGRRFRGDNAVTTFDQVVMLLELADLLDRSPQTLSGGQKQRVAIGRALLGGPQLLLLDEPLANVDRAGSGQCLRGLQRVREETGLPMLYVSHDIEEVSQLAEHLLLLKAGRLVGQGSLLELCGRLDTELSHEEQAAAILAATISRHDEQFGLTELSVDGQTLFVQRLSQQAGSRRRVRVAARDVSVCRELPRHSSILNILQVTLGEIEQTDAARLLLRLSLGSQHLLARITRKSLVDLQLREGDSLYAQIKSAALLMEPADEL